MPQRVRIARLAVPIFLLSPPAGARETRQLTAVRVGPGAIQVDGSLDDPGWGRKRSSQVVSTQVGRTP